jgi:hypothetical protein
MDRTFRRIAHRLRPLCRSIAVVIGLSLAPGAALAARHDTEAATAELSRPTLEAAVAADRLTLRVEGAPLAEVLRAIGAAGGFDVVLRGELAEPVNQSFTSEPLEDAIRTLVGRHSLIVIHGDPTSGEGATALAEIRVTANRRQLSSDTEGAGPSPSVPAVTPEEEATDPIDQQEAYRQAVLDYIPPTKDDLLFELDEPDRATRVAAVPKVGMLPPRAAIEVVSHVFANDDDATVRSRAVAALTRLDGPGARGLLRARALGDDDPGLRMQALNALASSRGERAVNVLGRALRHDPELRVRISAIRALGRVGGDWARRSLERATRDFDPEISLAAERALAARPEPAK